MLKVGIIGLGVGERHIYGYEKNKNCKVTMLCDFNDEKQKYAKEKFSGIKLTKNPNDILFSKDIDVVSIASYDNYHYEQIIKALNNDKHVYSEKPFCLYEKEAYSIRRLLNKKRHLKFSVNFVLRITPRFINLKDMIRNKYFGEIFSIEGDYNYGRVQKITEGWRGKIDYYSVVYGGAVHLIDLILWLTGDKAVEVSGYGNAICTKGSHFKYNDFASALIKFKSGMIAKVSANFGCVYPHFHKLNIYGTKMTFENGFEKGYLYKSREKFSKPEELFTEYPAVDKGKLINNFIDSIINNNTSNCADVNEVFDTMSVCFAIEKSIKLKHPVKVKYY